MSTLTEAEELAIEEAIQERAAILEYDGGEKREESEHQARSAMRVYFYRLTDNPRLRYVMIAPGCTLADARKSLAGRFGPKRLIEVLPHL